MFILADSILIYQSKSNSNHNLTPNTTPSLPCNKPTPTMQTQQYNIMSINATDFRPNIQLNHEV